MTMSVTSTEKRTGNTYRMFDKVSFVCVTAADGTATGSTSKKYAGEVWRLVVVPDGGGTQPTNLFDVTVTDADSYDVLAGQGANLSNAATTTVTTSMGAVVGDTLTVNVSNAGNTKGLTVIIYLKQ